MTRHRAAVVVGLLLVTAALVVPLSTCGALGAASLPYQDAPPDLLQRQAAEVAALEAELAGRLRVSAVLLAAAMVTLGYPIWRRIRRRREPPA